MKNLNLLIIDDVADDAELIVLQLKSDKIKFSWTHVDTEKKLKESLINEKWDAIISDYAMPGFDGLAALKIVKEWDEDMPFIMVSGTIGEDVAVDAMKKGAQDYLMKGKMKRLGQALLREINDAENRRYNKKVGLALAKSEAELKSIFMTSPVGIGIIYEDRVLQYVNEKISEITGYSEDELIGKSSRIFYIDDDEFNKIGNKIYSDVEKIGIGSIEALLKRKDGKKIDVQINLSRINDKDKTKGYTFTFNDITDRKRNEKIKSILYSISNAVTSSKDLKELVDLIRNQLGEIVDTTNFFVALYDEKTDTFELPYYSDEKDNYNSFPAGKSMTAYVIKTQKSVLAKWNEISELEKLGVVETIGVSSKIWLGVPLKIKDKFTGVLVLQSYEDENAYTQDDLNTLEIISQQVSISIERKKAEEDLKLALKRAKESDKLKSSFLSTISHELRTPLNAIIGFSEIINDETTKEDIINFTKMINRSGHDLFEIIEDILEVTNIESGKTLILKKEVKLYPIMSFLTSEIELIKEKESKKHLEIIVDLPAETKDLKLFTNSVKIKKVFIHFLRNAIKFTEKGSIKYGLISENDRIIFYVKDSGIGIPENKQDVVFDSFRQIDDSHTRKYGGMGIGLTIVKKIIELLDGEIWFDSVEGKGSTFYFSMPVVTKDTEIKIDIKKAKKALEGKTILVAEDEDSNFMLLEKIFGMEKINVIRGVNGKETVEKFKENKEKIDLILMDIKMPVMNGYEATKEIRIISDIPVIALSAYTSAEDKEEAIDCGCNDFIEKPIRRPVLLEKIADSFEV
ncbi:MAG: response regulator [Bacteroidales bacterium]|nr:response regulator [Bacteroidales bacterium]